MANNTGSAQKNAFQLTINNPTDYGYDHHKIKELLINNFTTLQYFCMADEIGEKGTYHTHIYVYFKSRVRFSTVKKHFNEAHIEPAQATAEANRDYIRKTGRWEETIKKASRIDGTFEEWGTFPTQKGKNEDMQELYEMVKNGYTNAEILATNNDYILQIDKLDKLRTMLLTEKYKGERRLDLQVVYISGATGTGKTRGILDKHGDINVYRVTDYKHPFDGYSCQPVLVFDEFRSQLEISDMLNFCDIYPLELPARYSNKYACYNYVYIVSNWCLEDQYQDDSEQDDNEKQGKSKTAGKESLDAFYRRIHKVIIYNADRTIVEYNSVNEYLHRMDEFIPIEDWQQEEVPFN